MSCTAEVLASLTVEVLSGRFLLRPVDFERSVAWYRDVLGLRVAREFGIDDRVTGVVFFLGGAFLELSGSGAHGVSNSAVVTLWLQVNDLSAEHERLAASGVTVESPPRRMPWGLDEMWIQGPDGERLVLVEVPPEHPLRRRL